MANKFAYTDDDDKCYGVAGMVISLNVFDHESMLKSVNIDSPEGEYIEFTPDSYFSGNPLLSAKTVWNEMLKQYQLYTALVMGNVICRLTVGRHQSLTHELMQQMHDMIDADGREQCSLEKDEIDMVFDKTYNYLYRLYANRQIQAIASSLCDTLKQRRSLSGSEVMDQLMYLRRTL